MNNQHYRKEYNWYVIDKSYKEVFGPYKSHHNAQNKANRLDRADGEHMSHIIKSHKHPITKH